MWIFQGVSLLDGSTVITPLIGRRIQVDLARHQHIATLDRLGPGAGEKLVVYLVGLCGFKEGCCESFYFLFVGGSSFLIVVWWWLIVSKEICWILLVLKRLEDMLQFDDLRIYFCSVRGGSTNHQLGWRMKDLADGLVRLVRYILIKDWANDSDLPADWSRLTWWWL